MPTFLNIPDKLINGVQEPPNQLGLDVVNAFQGGLQKNRKKQEDEQSRLQLVESVKELMRSQNRQFGETPDEDQNRFAESLVGALGAGIDGKTAPFLFPPDPNSAAAAGGGLTLEDLLGGDAGGGQVEAPDEGPGFLSQILTGLTNVPGSMPNLGANIAELLAAGGLDGQDGQAIDPSLVIEENPEGGTQAGRPGGILGRGLRGIRDVFGGLGGDGGTTEGQQIDTTPQQPKQTRGGVERGQRFIGPDGTSLFIDPETGNFVDVNGRPVLNAAGIPIQ